MLPDRECLRCKCRRFEVIESKSIIADFSREGAIEGCPLIENLPPVFVEIRCAECGAPVGAITAAEMRKEII